jgi:hypothetical protein
VTATDAPARPVVPLRPLGAADVLDGGFRLLRAAPAAVLVPALVVAVVVTVADTAVRLALDPTAAVAGSVGGTLLAGLVLQVAGALVSTVGAAVVAAFLAGVLVLSLSGSPLTLAAVWRTVRGRLVVAVVVGLLVGIAQTVGLAFLVAPGVWLWGLFAVAVPATVVERASVVGALRRSAVLVTGGFWRVFGLRALAALTAVAFSYLFRVPFTLLGNAVDGSQLTQEALVALGTLLTSAVVLPLRAAVDVMIYLDQRIRREAFDVTVALAGPAGPREAR